MNISLVTIVKNEAAALRRLLGSGLAIPESVATHIIVDGDSTDGSLEICRNYARTAPRCVKVLNQKGTGIYDALNQGFDAAPDEIIGLLHANDRFANPDVLQQIRQMFEEDSSLELVYANLYFENEKGKIVRRYSASRFTPEKLKDGFMPPHSTIYVRRSLWQRVGHYDCRYIIGADFEWLVRAMLKEKAVCRYLPVDMVAMSSGGISSRFINRIWRTPCEKWLALRRNGFDVSPFRLLKRYFHLLDD